MNSFDDDFDAEHDYDEDEDRSIDALVWQLLVLINPGDDDMAMQQFAAYREAVADIDPDEIEPLPVIGRVIDWRSGFLVDADDTRALVQAIDELVSRWNLRIDWNGDPDDDDFHDEHDVPALFALAYERLAQDGYTLWAWETDDDRYAGWITLTRDSEPLRELATALGINLRLGIDVS